VWFDKCCIDQTNIDADLRCLPVFLSGCKQIVVFCGTSYLTRLWCIVELFSFVQMGRPMDSIEFRVLTRDGCEEQDVGTIVQAFEHFDARECECFLAEDKERMLQIILAAFGDLSSFNGEVSATFHRADFEAVLRTATGGFGLHSTNV